MSLSAIVYARFSSKLRRDHTIMASLALFAVLTLALRAVLVVGSNSLAVMGGIKIIVPPDIHVSVKGIGIMGGFSPARRTAPAPDAPRLHIDGIALMGGVEIKVLSHGEEDE